MDFTYDDEQLALQEVARTALERECTPDVVRQLADDPDGITPGLWSTLVELGWTGLLVPEENGGSGTGLLEMCVVLEQRAASPCRARSSPPRSPPPWPPAPSARPSSW